MKVLYLSYNGLTEPLGRRQVLPYLVGLAARGWEILVISFEKPETDSAQAARMVRAEAAQSRIEWLPLRYHRRPTVPATLYDCLRGFVRGAANRRDVGLIHARSSVPALMASALAAVLGVPWIYDVRGLVAEEYADGGHWTRESRLFRLTDRVERNLLRRADGLVFLTDKIRALLDARQALPSDKPTAVIPCCADLDVFQPSSPAARDRVRNTLGVGSAPLLVYSGSLGSWYRIDEMMRFFALARAVTPDLRFLVLTPQTEIAESAARVAGRDGEVVVRSLPPDEVPAYLAAADAGICFLSDSFSKSASSPTKYGEYLACGLPVIATEWTGDAARLKGERSWIGVRGFDDEALNDASRRFANLLGEREVARSAARDLAGREFGLQMAVDRYDELYRKVLGQGTRMSG